MAGGIAKLSANLGSVRRHLAAIAIEAPIAAKAISGAADGLLTKGGSPTPSDESPLKGTWNPDAADVAAEDTPVMRRVRGLAASAVAMASVAQVAQRDAARTVEEAGAVAKDNAKKLVRFGIEVTDEMARLMDLIGDRFTVYGAKGDGFLKEFMRLQSDSIMAMRHNNTIVDQRAQQREQALVDMINLWLLGGTGERLDLSQLRAMIKKKKSTTKSSYNSSNGGLP